MPNGHDVTEKCVLDHTGVAIGGAGWAESSPAVAEQVGPSGHDTLRAPGNAP